jgi:hypothetical protein
MSDWPLVIISCDAFRDTWLPHLQLWDKYGGGKRREYLVTESERFAARPDVTVVHPVASEYRGSSDWMGLVASAIRQIDAPYLLFTLDDFFLKAPIDWPKIEHYAALALRDDCDTLTLGVHDTTRRGGRSIAPGLLEVDDTSPYWITTSPSLWKRAALLALLNERHGSAWEFEFTQPAALAFRLKQYMVDRQVSFLSPLWPYYAEFWAGVDAVPVLSDSAIAKGKWQKGMPQFLAHNGINGVQFWQRGFHSYRPAIVGRPWRKLAARLGILWDLLVDIAIRPRLRRRAVAQLAERLGRGTRGPGVA